MVRGRSIVGSACHAVDILGCVIAWRVAALRGGSTFFRGRLLRRCVPGSGCFTGDPGLLAFVCQLIDASVLGISAQLGQDSLHINGTRLGVVFQQMLLFL